MRLISIKYQDLSRVALVENKNQLRLIDFNGDMYALIKAAVESGSTIESFINSHSGTTILDYEEIIKNNLVQVPCMHPDPAHCLVSGTGLTHTGSAQTRSSMHLGVKEEELTDSMKMFQEGLKYGKPKSGIVGAEPEWFYKGDGSIVVPSGGAFQVPRFAEDAGEEPELAGLYFIDSNGQPIRIGFCLGNEFSDHVKEKRNYLLLAHSKLRPCSIGPEILIGELPQDLRGTSRIIRDGKVLWEKEVLTGEANMAHSFENLEYHHFKYKQFRRPGDLHIHFFGTATLSFADDIKTKEDDIFSIEFKEFGRPLENSLKFEK